MSQALASERSFAKIEMEDLRRLLNIAQADRADRFHRCPEWRELYSDRLLCVALCQGAAQHYVDGSVGINDFDLWTFYAQHPEKAFPPRWRLPHDFGDAKFGQTVDSLNYVGRRVDCLSRSIPANVDEDPARALQRYLKGGRTGTAKYLRTRSVVLLEPVARMGEIIWKVE